MTPDDWQALADRARAAALKAARAGDVEGAARESELEEMYRRVLERLSRTHLRTQRKMRTLPHVEPAADRGANISRARTKTPSRLQALLQERGLSLRGWVTAMPKSRRPSVAAVTAWCRPRERAGRAIPALWAERFAEDLDAPELRDPASWPCGIQ